MPKQKIKLKLPANLEFSSLVRRIAEEVFGYVGFKQEWSDRLELVVDELFMNACQYGSRRGKGAIHLQFSFDGQEVMFRIEDEGAEKKTEAKELRQKIEKNCYEATDMTKTRGRGLALISNLWTDKMTVDDSRHGGIAISFTKRITSEPPPTSPFFVNSTCPVKREVDDAVSNTAYESIPIEGEIDSSNIEEKIRPIAKRVLSLAKATNLHLDCEKLTYINSTFIGHLVSWRHEVQQGGGNLVLRKVVNKQVREVLDLVGMSDIISLEP